MAAVLIVGYGLCGVRPTSPPTPLTPCPDLMLRVFIPASDLDGSYSSSRLLLEALRMIRSRQRQGRGDPQPASTDIMDGVWSGRWDPAKRSGDGGSGDGEGGGGDAGGDETSSSEVRASRSSRRGDDPRCAVCLEEVGGGGGSSVGESAGGTDVAAESGPEEKEEEEETSQGLEVGGEFTADIGSNGAEKAETDAHARGRFAYLPCGHRFHTHW